MCVGRRGRGLKRTGRVKNRVEGNMGTELTRCIRRNTTSMEKPSNADLCFSSFSFLFDAAVEKINKNSLQVTLFTQTVYCRLLDSVVSRVETVTNSMGLGSLFKTSKESVASLVCMHIFSSFFMNSIQVLAVLLVPRLRFDVDGSPLFLPLINFITLSPTPLHLTKR